MSPVLEWLFYTSTWYVMLLAIGLIFFPLARVIFGKFYDYGYGLSKAIGIAVISYAIFALGTAHILPFTHASLYGILAVAIFFNYRLYKRNPLKKNSRLGLILFEEVLFLLAFFAWSYVRAQEPAIRGLEKFMDFGFINSVLRGDYFPSQDIWLAGKPINYYYFGHITGAVLTKISFIPSYITYNLILAQLFGLSVAGVFTLGFNMAYHGFKRHLKFSFIAGIISTFLVNISGNLHAIYAFTTGYPNDKPAPFWEIPAKYSFADWAHPILALNKLPLGYWYPNATRFVPYSIHEFPLYSYVVADLHGHVFDIPFVLITIGVLFSLFLHTKGRGLSWSKLHPTVLLKNIIKDLSFEKGYLGFSILLGFLLSMHLMTNAFDAPIYLALSGIVLLSMFGFSQELFIYTGVIIVSFVVFNYPFSIGFEPFASGVGFNCVPPDLGNVMRGILKDTAFETRFIFEENCQSTPWWMLLTLWGFFWFNFIFLAIHTAREKFKIKRVTTFMLILFAFSTMLIVAPEFVYAKDIYPSHFRANTMFKLGYEAFIMMGIASAYTFTLFKSRLLKDKLSILYVVLFIPLFGLVALYPTFAITSYYGNLLDKQDPDPPRLVGNAWISGTYEEYAEIIEYLNSNVEGQPTILEAQGDSYTDFNVVSSYTGLPTVGGWFVHEWLWRGHPDAVGALAPDIQKIYEGENVSETERLLSKYSIRYVVIGSKEFEKYPETDASKFEALGKAVFRTKSGNGVIFEIPIDTH